jgi:hypothetical protein
LRDAFNRVAGEPSLPNAIETLRRQRAGSAKHRGKEQKADH